jgi:hypothetical protein
VDPVVEQLLGLLACGVQVDPGAVAAVTGLIQADCGPARRAGQYRWLALSQQDTEGEDDRQTSARTISRCG